MDLNRHRYYQVLDQSLQVMLKPLRSVRYAPAFRGCSTCCIRAARDLHVSGVKSDVFG